MTINDFTDNIRRLITPMNMYYDFDESLFNILDDILNQYKNTQDENIKQIIKEFSQIREHYYNNEKILDMVMYNEINKLIELTEIYM